MSLKLKFRFILLQSHCVIAERKQILDELFLSFYQNHLPG